MDLELRGRVALVTCASSGLGRSCVERLLEEGAEVLATSRSISREQFAGLPGIERLHCVQADVEDGPAFESAMRVALHRLPTKPTIFVHLPVREPNLPLEAIDQAQVETAIDRNFTRFMFLAQSLLPYMRAASFGRVVTLLGASTLAPLSDHVLANISRISIASAAAGFGRENAAHNICANNILLGVFDTPGLRALWAGRAASMDIPAAQHLAQGTQRIPVQRLGRPDECARLCALLCSPTIGYLNGQSLLADGGLNTNL